MREKIENKVKEIIAIILNHQYDNTYGRNGLYSGRAGDIMFLSLAYQYFSKPELLDHLSDILVGIAEDLNDYRKAHSFCYGTAGIGWLMEYLVNNKIVAIETDEVLSDVDQFLNYEMIRYLQSGNYDFLNGAIGLLLYFHNRLASSVHKKQISDYMQKGIKLLHQIGEESPNQIKWYSPKYGENGKATDQLEVKICLSHGIASIVSVLSKVRSNRNYSGEREVLDMIIEKSINYLNAQRINYDEFGCHFPNQSLESESPIKSRLAWCYGDLGISRALVTIGKQLMNEKLIDEGLYILSVTTGRRNLEDNYVIDAGVCHGSAGIALSYMLWENEVGIEFKEVIDYWIKKTLDYSMYEDGLAGYKSYNGLTKEYETDASFLTGIGGIGCVLLTYLNPENNNWTEMLLYK